MPSVAIAEEVEKVQALMARLCVQLEATDGDDALAVLQTYAARLEESIEATRPAAHLLLLPPELLGLVLAQLLRLQYGACAALRALTSTSTLFTAGVGKRLLVSECVKLCPALASHFADSEDYDTCMLEYTALLLEFEERRNDPENLSALSPRTGMHTAFIDLAALCMALVHHEAQRAREVLGPFGFVVGDPTKHDPPGTRQQLVRIQCSIPGLPGTLHDGALHECNLVFCIGVPEYDADRNDNEIYPWRPPMAYVLGQVYHCQLHGGTAELGQSASCCSRLLNKSRQAWDITYCVTETLLHLQYFLHSHNLQDPGQKEPYMAGTCNVPLFRQKTRDWALSTQAASSLPEPPRNLMKAMLDVHVDVPMVMDDDDDDDDDDRLVLDEQGCKSVFLGGEWWQIFRRDFRPFTNDSDLEDGRLVARDRLP